MIILYSVLRINNNYYPQTLLEECKYKIKNYKMKGHIDCGFDSEWSDDSDNEPDNESDNNESENEPDNNESDNGSDLIIMNLASFLTNLKSLLSLRYKFEHESNVLSLY